LSLSVLASSCIRLPVALTSSRAVPPPAASLFPYTTLFRSGQTVTLRPNSTSRAINVGGTSDPGSSLYLSTANLNSITAGTLVIEHTSAHGWLKVTSALATTSGSALTNIGNLSLLSGSGTID